MQFYNNIPGLLLSDLCSVTGLVGRFWGMFIWTRGAVFSGAGTQGCVFSACVITLMTTHLPRRISPVNKGSYQISWECLVFFWKQCGLGSDDKQRGCGCSAQQACWGALLFWMTFFNHLSPVMKCDCYSKVLASAFDSISVPLQTLLDCVDSWEKHFSCKFATCDAGIMAGWLGV